MVLLLDFNQIHLKQLNLNFHNKGKSNSNSPYEPSKLTSLHLQVFNDFGDAFKCYDTNGEQPISTMVSAIDENGVVACQERIH